MHAAYQHRLAAVVLLISTVIAIAPSVASASAKTTVVVSTPTVAAQVLSPLTTSFVHPESPLRLSFDRKNRLHSLTYTLSDFTGQFTSQSAGWYGSALALRADSRYRRLPAGVLQPLDTKWTNVAQTRAEILSGCQSLDGRDSALKAESESIDATQANHARRSADLKTAMLSWNARCSVPNLSQEQYDECAAQRSQLEASRSQLNQEVAALNDVIAAFNAKLHQMQADAPLAEDQWNAWAAEIQSLIDSIKAAFARKMLRCDYVSKGTNGLCIYNCEKIGVVYLMPDLPDETCSNPRFVPDDGSGGVGATRADQRKGDAK